jgi:SanA protein
MIVLGLFAFMICCGMYWYVGKYAEDYLSDVVLDLPEVEVALVLGTSERVSDGRLNVFFVNRMRAAYELYEAGKIEKILVSGDNGREDYNEPESMKDALMNLGVAEEDITLDYAGFRTLDSVVRAEEIFGLDEMIIVSQKFHNERALFIARSRGLEAYAYNARSPQFGMAPRVFIREVLARVYMIWDLYVNDTGPKYLGEELEV